MYGEHTKTAWSIRGMCAWESSGIYDPASRRPGPTHPHHRRYRGDEMLGIFQAAEAVVFDAEIGQPTLFCQWRPLRPKSTRHPGVVPRALWQQQEVQALLRESACWTNQTAKPRRRTPFSPSAWLPTLDEARRLVAVRPTGLDPYNRPPNIPQKPPITANPKGR